jgi:hypothetical protein
MLSFLLSAKWLAGEKLCSRSTSSNASNLTADGLENFTGGTYTYTYTPLNSGATSDDPNLPVMRTQQTNPNGNVTQYDYNRLGYPVVKREFTHGI